jgi:signal transduction histidine kinase
MNQLSTTNDEVVFTILVTAFILISLVGFIVSFIFFYQKRRIAHINEITSVTTKFQQTLLQSQLEIKEQTLKHIAFELHDNLGQIASLIKINLNTLRLEDYENSVQKIEATKELIRQLIADLKFLSISLNGDRIAKLGLMRGLQDETDRLNKTGQFKATLVADDPIPSLNENTTVILYRMAQEILNNIVKHSAANHVHISLHFKEKLFTLVIKDNGVGFNPEDKMKSGGSGLINLTSRAKLIQAMFSIQSSAGNGTRICIELPIQNAESTSH